MGSIVGDSLPLNNNDVDKLTYVFEYGTGKKLQLFNNAVIVPVQLPKGTDKKDKKRNDYSIFRNFANYVYIKYMDNSDESANKVVKRALGDSTSIYRSGFLKNLTVTGEGKITELAKQFMADQSVSRYLYQVKNASRLSEIKASGGVELLKLDVTEPRDLSNVIKKLTNSEGGIIAGILSEKEVKERIFGRSAKVFYTSGAMECVNNVLGVKDGTEFAVYASNIYLTYLNWYGLKYDKATGEYTSDLNMSIYKDGSLIKDISEVSRVPTKEEMMSEVLNYAYLMLHPTEGIAYRNRILMSNFSSSLYSHYQRLSGVDNSNITSSSGVSSGQISNQSSKGFLAVEDYQENWMTSYIMSHYAKIAIILIAAGILLVLITKILYKKSFSWLLLSVVAIVATVLMIPTMGQVTPYVCNNVLERLFQEHMGYWSICEQAYNANIERELINQSETQSAFSRLSEEEIILVNSLSKSVSSLYTDKYISIKQDISNKVDGSGYSSAFADIQSLQSARWILPMILRQWSASDGTADYVYVTLADKIDDCSNLYWYYKPEDAEFAQTVTSKDLDGTAIKFEDDTKTLLTYENTQLYELNGYGGGSGKPSDNYSSMRSSSTGTDESFRSISYTRNPTDLPHTYFYYINKSGVLNSSIKNVSSSDYEKKYDEWAEACASTCSGTAALDAIARDIISCNYWYSRYDRGSITQLYGYLWSTESPLQYFYESVKDSFSTDSTLYSLVAELQGEFLRDDSDGLLYRSNFMYDSDTHKTRDVLDLEEMFNNYIPYIYSMQLAALGTGDDNGAIKNDELINYYMDEDSLYAGNPHNGTKVNWLFRSNWVTKFMDSPDNHRAETISGKTIVNPLLPWEYNEQLGRDMVFSEAQQAAAGLEDSDLTIAELRCIEINREVCKDWTKLLNYVSVSGVNKEVLLRQMAIDALIIFDKTFTSNGFISNRYMMHPTGLELRSISFDSIMGMIMSGVTRDSSYKYGNVMETLLTESDFFSAILYMMVALMSITVIPLARTTTLGIMFIFTVVALIRSLVRPPIERVKTTVGFVGCNLIYGVVIVLFMCGVRSLMGVVSTDQLIKEDSFSFNIDSPRISAGVLLVFEGIFVIASIALIVYMFKNHQDMGFEDMKYKFGVIYNKATNFVDKLSKGDLASGIAGNAKGSQGGLASGHMSNAPGSGLSGKVEADVKNSKTGKRDRNRPEKQALRDTSDNYHYSTNRDKSDIRAIDNDYDSINKKVESGSKLIKNEMSSKSGEDTGNGGKKISGDTESGGMSSMENDGGELKSK